MVFRSPSKIISEWRSAFTFKKFKKYCKHENIKHIVITTGVPKLTSQIEHLHDTFISVLAKLSIDEPNIWYNYADSVQRVINFTTSQSMVENHFER